MSFGGLMSVSDNLTPCSWDSSSQNAGVFNFEDVDEITQRENLIQTSARKEDEQPLSRGGHGVACKELGSANTLKGVGGSELETRRKNVREGGGDKTRSSSESEARQNKMEVIRRLLATFNLEESIARHRHLAASSFTIEPADFSFDW